MKILTTISLFALLALVPAAFADHPTATVSMPQGSGDPSSSCQKTDECFIPSEVSVDVGGSVTWVNDDSLLHFVTAGDLNEDKNAVGFDYPNGFDSPLLNAGESYTVEDLKEGTYPYFCKIHPWMDGTLYVTASHGDNMEANGSAMMEKDGEKMMDGDKDAMDGMMMDDDKMMDGEKMTGDEDMMMGEMMMMEGKVPESLEDVMVNIETQGGDMGSPLQINVAFTDADGNNLSHVNYMVTAMQGEEMVLEDGTDDSNPAHSHTGMGDHTTAPLLADASEMPVDVSVYLYGFGVDEITGPSGDVASYRVVPEFGAVAMAVLGVAIVSIIAITAKTRLVPKI